MTALAAARIGLRRAVVALERDDLGRRVEVRGEIEDVAHRRGAEGVDRLRVVADHGEAAPVGLQRQQDRGLQAVGVLVLVDQDVVEAAADLLGERRLGDHLRPVEQQVVVVEHVLALLGLDVGGEQLPQLLRPRRAPGERGVQHVVERHLGVDAARVDGRGTCPSSESGSRSSRSRARGAPGSSGRRSPRGRGW